MPGIDPMEEYDLQKPPNAGAKGLGWALIWCALVIAVLAVAFI